MVSLISGGFDIGVNNLCKHGFVGSRRSVCSLIHRLAWFRWPMVGVFGCVMLQATSHFAIVVHRFPSLSALVWLMLSNAPRCAPFVMVPSGMVVGVHRSCLVGTAPPIPAIF